MSAPLQLGLFSPRWTVSNPSASTGSAPIITHGGTDSKKGLVREPPPRAAIREPYKDPFLASIEPLLDAAGDDPITFKGWNHALSGTAVGLDVESYENFFLVMLKRFCDGTYLAFERSARTDFDADALMAILRANVIVTFNGLVYDLPITALALTGADPARLKRATNEIIAGNHKPWEIERLLGVRSPRINHIDLMEPNPSIRMNLKMLNGRLHGRFVVDLPYDPDARLTPRQMNVTTLYCGNDLDSNQVLYEAMREPLQLRVALGKRYGADFRSKSDSQIGETIVRRRLETLGGRRLDLQPDHNVGAFAYQPPDFLRFRTETMREVLERVCRAAFHVTGAGKVSKPPELEELMVSIGASRYSMGNGGLHSTEANRAIISSDRVRLIDVDVASQYPRIILNLGLYPKALGPAFLEVYRAIVEERLEAKRRLTEIEKVDLPAARSTGAEVTRLEAERESCRVMAEGLKISVNGVYGKLSSPYSFLYAPPLAVTITLTGQLAVLMLVERAEMAGIAVVSANTDGVIFHCPIQREAVLDEIIKEWESDTGFEIERTPYRAIYSSSVNGYIALKEDGKAKVKGPLADPWTEKNYRDQLQKNPMMTICTRALIARARDGTPFEETIRAGTDPREFVSLIRANAGASWRGVSLGKAIRFYWSTEGEPILTRGKNRVSRTEGARPMQELVEALPRDLDHLRYCEETARLGIEMGLM